MYSIKIDRQIPLEGLKRIIGKLLPTRLSRDSTMFDVGYEAAKKDIADIFGDVLKMNFDQPHAAEILKQLNRDRNYVPNRTP